MAIKPIITIPNNLLKNPTKKVNVIDDEIKNIVQDLIDTVLQAEDPEGAGLSANQIGVDKKICVVRNFYEDLKTGKISSEEIVLINPKIISHSKEENIDWEGCLSIPDAYGKVSRYQKIKVLAKDLNNQRITIKANGYFARVIQHEIDHLNGILFTERVIGNTISEEMFNKIQL